MAFSTSNGDGKFLSSGPWLWIATLMLYSLTNFSSRGRTAALGMPMISGMPAVLTYSNLARMSASSHLVEGNHARAGDSEAGLAESAAARRVSSGGSWGGACP